jgi:hypothetical protein
MKTLGIDVGYSYTKTSERTIFRSKFMPSDDTCDGEQIIIDGNSYIIGMGEDTVDVNKVSSQITKNSVLTAIATTGNHGENVYCIVTGLPIIQYHAQKEELREMILECSNTLVVYKNQEGRVKIKDVRVYPQGAGALFAYRIPGEAIMVDVGARTVDIAYFRIESGHRYLAQYNSLYCGMLPLYSEIIKEINKRLELTLTANDGEGIIADGLKIYGEQQDLTFLSPIVKAHLAPLINELTLNYPVKTTPIYLVGGGSCPLEKILKRKFKNAELMADFQFANAIGFGQIGEVTEWEKR